MKNVILGIALVVTVVGVSIAVRSCFPVTQEVPVIRIVTQYDTVETLDTAWVTRLKTDTLKVNVVERVTVTVPETVYVLPAVAGITALSVPQKVGDSTLATGFRIAPLPDSGYGWRAWQAQYYTLGALKSINFDDPDSVPRINFYNPPKDKPCGDWCRLGHYLTGGSVAVGLTTVACVIAR